ncbi:MAG: CPBP family glutamic-type intramembrane protease [Bacilli bacterium]|nr:CPBP family glutamic-type intramembrane protease [Bacilli bacterium]
MDSLFPVPSYHYGTFFTFVCGSFECLFLNNLALDMLVEELFKFALFILVLALTYKLSGDRKISIVCASVVTLVIFGASHFQPNMGGWMRVVSDIIIRGVGSFFDFYAYLKTKNIWVSYFIHLFYDIIPC